MSNNNFLHKIKQSLHLNRDLINNQQQLITQIQANPQDFQLLQRIPIELFNQEIEINPLQGDEIPLMFIDVESTGLDIYNDLIIELGYVKVLYSPSSEAINKVMCNKSFFNDPGFVLDDKVVQITGITNEILVGHKLTYQMVAEDFADNPILIAHNASFDRPMIDRHFPELAYFRWGCSLREIDWRNAGVDGVSLSAILRSNGWFYSAHRANIDCLAMLWLFLLRPELLVELYSSIQLETYRFIVDNNNSYNFKDTLKTFGYRWNGEAKYWYRDLVSDSLDKANLFEQQVKEAIPELRHRYLQFGSESRFALAKN